jgi:hypothetical protein
MAFGETAIYAPRKGFIGQWWHEWKSNRDAFAALGRCGHDEVEHIALDLSLTAAELRTLARKGVDSALLLYRRMADLDLDRAEVAYAQPKVMRDLNPGANTRSRVGALSLIEHSSAKNGRAWHPEVLCREGAVLYRAEHD